MDEKAGSERSFQIKKVAVIGAGPSGIATAKYLLAEKAFDQITVFEQQASTGGVWNYFPDTISGLSKVPQTRPESPVEYLDHAGKPSSLDESFTSPMYDQLETNIPHLLMRYSDQPFPEDAQLFPARDTVLRYLQDYARDVSGLIRFNTRVVEVRPAAEHTGGWDLTTKDIGSARVDRDRFDAIVVASGHYDAPYIPDIKGIAGWNQRYPGTISHSKFYRASGEFKGKKVIVVGNSASGTDIGSQISAVCQEPLIISCRSPSKLSMIPAGRTKKLPEIEELMPFARALRFRDGHLEDDVDAVLFCTGYLYSYPFLSSLRPALIEDGSRTKHVYKHMFYKHQPTLAFVALPQRIIPFPFAECQAAIIARVWANRLKLPSLAEMNDWEERLLEDRGSEKMFHVMHFPRDADYMEELRRWSLRAAPASNGLGKMPPTWTDRERWLRGNTPNIKEGFARLGEARHRVRKPEDLGVKWGQPQTPSTVHPDTDRTQTERSHTP